MECWGYQNAKRIQSVQSLCGVHTIHTLVPLGKKYGPSFEAKGSQDLELHLAQWHYAFMAFKLEGRKWHPKLRADGFLRILLGFFGRSNTLPSPLITWIWMMLVCFSTFWPDSNIALQVATSRVTCKPSLCGLRQRRKTAQCGAQLASDFARCDNLDSERSWQISAELSKLHPVTLPVVDSRRLYSVYIYIGYIHGITGDFTGH